MTALSTVQQEVLDLLSEKPYLDVRSDGQHAYIFDVINCCQYTYPIRVSTLRALLKANKLTKHSTDILTGHTIYKPR